MLYLDSSALVKHYYNEIGSYSLNKRLQVETENARPVFTSVLTYAEVHSSVARRTREKLLSLSEAAAVHDKFDTDWVLGFTAISLDVGVLGFIRDIFKAHPLKSADAVHLASALWLRDSARLSGRFLQRGEPLIFASSDRQLSTAAQKYNLETFDPETMK